MFTSCLRGLSPGAPVFFAQSKNMQVEQTEDENDP